MVPKMYESLDDGDSTLFLCEYKDCSNVATTEWFSKDEEGDGYFTSRCDDHPVDDNEYQPRGI